MPMQNATRYAEDYRPTAPHAGPRRLTDPPEWCGPFLQEMLRQAIRHRRCNVQTAAELAGVTRDAAYKYSRSANGDRFRVAWELIVLGARTRHANR